MLEVLEKEKTYVVVKMDIVTYDNIQKKEKGYFDDLIEDARNSKSFATVDELFDDLNN